MSNRFAIVGATGSGKSTLAKEVGRKLIIPVIDLDALHWGPNWTMTPTDIFREQVSNLLQGSVWVVGGNYSKARDIIWSRSDTLIWLDYPLPIVFWRLFRRTVKRVVTQEELWNGNRETWRGQFLSRESLFLWLLRSRPRHRRDYPKLVTSEFTHLQLLHFTSQRATDFWLESLSKNP